MAKPHPAIKDLEDIRAVFERYGVPFFVVYGAVLGFHRDGDFLPGDDDVDLAVIDPIDLKTRKAIGWTLYDLGFEPQDIAFNVFGRMEPCSYGYDGNEETGIIVCERNFKFTIFFFKQDEEPWQDELVCIPKLGAVKLISTPKRFFEQTDTIKINGKKYQVPYPIEEYLAYSYGDGSNGHDWRDKDDRYHSPTWFEAHPEHVEYVDVEGKNQVVVYKKNDKEK